MNGITHKRHEGGEMGTHQQTFGKELRKIRTKRGFTLRKFAEAVGVSPTYLSQVEQENVMPPTADRVKRMAELLGENPDEWIGLAGRVPDDLPEIIQRQPTEMPELLREASGLTIEQLRELREQARKLKREGKK
jgi:transcriptional regulator with XRE-family HTH domain